MICNNMTSKYGFEVSETELKSATNIAKKIAGDYYKKNNRYDYDEYLSIANYAIVKSIYNYNKEKASFPTLVYINAVNEIKTMMVTDKKYNYARGEGIEKYKIPVSIDKPIKGSKDKEAKHYADILPYICDDENFVIVKDYINKVFDSMYEGFSSRVSRFQVNKQRDVDVIIDIIKGYTPIETSKRHNISNQLVNCICKKFKNFAIDNGLKYEI